MTDKSESGLVYLTSNQAANILGKPVKPNRMYRVCDPEILALYQQWLEMGRKEPSIDWVCSLVEYGNNKGLKNPLWWLENVSKTIYCEHNFNFMMDTLRFIITGERQMEPMSWACLLEFGGDNKMLITPKVITEQAKKSCTKIEIQNLCKQLCSSGENLMIRWAKQKDGLTDMICTLTAMYYGNPLKTNW